MAVVFSGRAPYGTSSALQFRADPSLPDRLDEKRRRYTIMKKNILVLFLISSFISTCYINESTSNENYFPLEIGNWWLYNFNYKPFGNEPLKKNGNISWRVIDKNNDELYIQEIIEGKTIDWTDLDSPNPDTTYFGPDTAITKFLYV